MNQIITYLKNTTIVEIIILLCLFFFIPGILASDFVIHWFALPADLESFSRKPWTILTYAFVHTRFLHILSNLLILFYFGNLFIDFFSARKFLIYYLSGTLVGGIFFLIFAILNSKIGTLPLAGASAAITTIFIGIATKVPHYALKFRFLGSIEIWILASIWIILSIFGTSTVDSGAALAHLGGVIIGFTLTKLFGEKESFFKWFKFSKNKNSFKKVYTQANIKTKPSFRSRKENQDQINLILDKISKKGYDSLTKEEKEFLFNQKES